MPAFPTQHLISLLDAFPGARRCWIAYSGGLDSEVLLSALVGLRERVGPKLCAIHVDHGLHPESSGWVDHCRARCSALSVPLRVRRLKLSRVPGESLEALAREARYAEFRESLVAGDLLLTAQHRDDQAETLLLALLRGSGVKGLAAMPAVAPLGDAWLLRPLLGESRQALLDYARGEGLVWLEDPSNADLSFDRNFVRARVLPLLAERWPSCAASIARTAAHCAEAQRLIDGMAEAEIECVSGRCSGTLSVSRLLARDPSLVRAILRYWLGRLGLPMPDSRHLSRIQREALRAHPDRSPLVAWKGCEIRRYRDDLFAMRPLPPVPGATRMSWNRSALTLPAGLGRLVLTDESGGPLDPVSIRPSGLDVRFGCEGLACRPTAGSRQRRLKQLFQQAGVPPWLRPYVPYLFIGESLIGVGDLWLCADGQSRAGRLSRIRWEGGVRAHPAFEASDRMPG